MTPATKGDTQWNFADVWEVLAELQPQARAQQQGTRTETWGAFDAAADGVAAWLLALGAGHQATFAQYLRNKPAYLDSIFGAFKAGWAPVNTNYRYGPAELTYLWRDAGCAAVVFDGRFAETVDAMRDSVPSVRAWAFVDDGTCPCPPWAEPFDEIAGAGQSGRYRRGPSGRSGDDLYLLYTGGTTGPPKGVMWRQDDLFCLLNRQSRVSYPEQAGLSGVRPAAASSAEPRPVHLCAAPLMHGTGAMCAFAALDCGGSVVTLQGESFNPVEFLDAAEASGATEASIVGDAFAKPVLQALEEADRMRDLSALTLMISAGVMWSEATKQGLISHIPGLVCADTLGASEALGLGASVSSSDSTAATGSFSLGESSRVIRLDGSSVTAGSGEAGLLAVRGRGPIGYLGDAALSERTFRVIEGERWIIPGDWATVAADGTVRLLGRGSSCINTGGEKVYAEEVEEALKLQAGVMDAAVVGVPDDRFGEAVVALVQSEPSGSLDEAGVLRALRAVLAGYKVPKALFSVESLGRAPNGKVDHARCRMLAADRFQARCAGALVEVSSE